MKVAKLLATVFLILTTLLVLGACEQNEEEKLDMCGQRGYKTKLCPPPSDISGYYVLCLKSYNCACIDVDNSTPNGIYEAGTEITATVKILCSETLFAGWHDSFTGEFVSGGYTYVFNLIEDTYLHGKTESTDF